MIYIYTYFSLSLSFSRSLSLCIYIYVLSLSLSFSLSLSIYIVPCSPAAAATALVADKGDMRVAAGGQVQFVFASVAVVATEAILVRLTCGCYQAVAIAATEI